MQQSKISAFFKTAAPATGNHPQPLLSEQAQGWDLYGNERLENTVTYKRRHPNPNIDSGDGDPSLNDKEIGGSNDGTGNPSLRCKPTGKILNKKRSYAQYHLDLGQSDFLLHSCSVCGLMYARGDEEDEKIHKQFHSDYYQGIRFKGWKNERVVSTPCGNGDRILLVWDVDPPAQKHKVQQVVKVMEKELGFNDGQLIHNLCTVYLYISSCRIVGCLVAEPIKAAHRVILSSSSCNNSNDIHTKLESPKPEVGNKDLKRCHPAILQFGNFIFQRELIKKNNPQKKANVDKWDRGAILCEEKAVPALCGIRAIWVVPSKRRKGIASQLLDAVRKSFCVDQTVEVSQFAFSPPTSAGKALASSYTGDKAFLVYKAEDVLYVGIS